MTDILKQAAESRRGFLKATGLASLATLAGASAAKAGTGSGNTQRTGSSRGLQGPSSAPAPLTRAGLRFQRLRHAEGNPRPLEARVGPPYRA